MTNVIVDWDKENDVIYVLKEGYDPSLLVNVDSDKAPGVVKRIDPQSDECVGFIIENFSYIFPRYKNEGMDNLMRLFAKSIERTNEEAAPKLDLPMAC